MKIRKTTMSDLPVVMEIYAQGREYMRKTGNPDQWKNNHPPEELIVQDIQAKSSYCCVVDTGSGEAEEILAVFYFAVEEDPTYAKIQGQWLNDSTYGVVHRIARGYNANAGAGCGANAGAGSGVKSVAAFCIDWCFDQHPNVRIDTHKDNGPMLRLLERLGFSYCGIIWLASGDERMAFQKV